MSKILAFSVAALSIIVLLAALAIFLLPLYFAFANDPIYLFGFFVSWIPALVVLFIGIGIMRVAIELA